MTAGNTMYEAYALLVYPSGPGVQPRPLLRGGGERSWAAGQQPVSAPSLREGNGTVGLARPHDRPAEDLKLVIGEDTEDEEEGAA